MKLKSYNRETPTHCYKCGKQLITKENQVGFDSMTGRPKLHTILKCPKAWGWGGNNYTGHAMYEFNQDGDEIICHNF